MAKPWAKYATNWINHPKFRALPAGAITFWAEGKAYADDHFSDGFLPVAQVKLFRFYSKKNVALLMTSIGPKSIQGETVYAPLWETHVLGYHMHDYLEHNECRDEALARMAVGNGTASEDQTRLHAKVRQQRVRDRKRDASQNDRDGERDASRKQRDVSSHTRSQSTDPSSKEQKKEDPPPPTSRSKRPIFSGQRLTVFEWMLDDCVKLLGPHTDAFDLHEFFFSLDAKCLQSGTIPPARDGGAWLQAETLAEAQRRGLPLKIGTAADAVASVGPSKRPVWKGQT